MPKIPRDKRRHTEVPEEDQRRPFEIDRDRVLYSLAFRRLAGVTQVVHAAEGHVFHNRLTHSLKVAQVARRLAEHIERTQHKLAEALGGINPDVVETAGLAHDLGHPPFGHIAEEELDARLRSANVPDGFEGNAQSFRVLTKVAIRRVKPEGLDLTRSSLNAVLKYPWPRNVAGKEFKKWGYYYSEQDDFTFARTDFNPADRRQCPEAALMDWADDVSYSVHDLDDFYRAGLIPLDQLLVGTSERGRFITFALDKWERKGELAGSRDEREKGALSFLEKLGEAGRTFARGLLKPFSGTREQQAGLKFYTSLLLKRYIVGTEQERAVKLVDSGTKPMVEIASGLREEVDLLKEIMACYVFEHPALVAQQYGQRRVIGELFDTFFKASRRDDRDHGLIPEPFRESLHSKEAVDDRERARVVADLIASLTEQQCLVLHQRICGLAPGSVRDLLVR